MKKTILVILFPVLILVVLIQLNALPVNQNDTRLAVSEDVEDDQPIVLASTVSLSNSDKSYSTGKTAVLKSESQHSSNSFTTDDKRSSIVDYAFTLLGSPYLYAGNTKDGFDCSGFITHVFDQNGISIKRSSGLQSTEGFAVNRSEAAPGDLLIFTGTDKSVREPGHVGIVISEPGDTIKFIHASSSRSDGGVKVSQVEGSGYEERFLQVRRVL